MASSRPRARRPRPVRQRSELSAPTRRRALVPVEHITRAILILRGHRVLLDSKLAALYGVETRVLNQAVKRKYLATYSNGFRIAGSCIFSTHRLPMNAAMLN
jgi:hypothetical protein